MPYPPVLTRAEAYAILDSERRYQDRQAWPENAPGQPVTLTIGEELLTILGYLHKAQQPQPVATVLEIFRKIAAMGVRAFENRGFLRAQVYAKLDATRLRLDLDLECSQSSVGEELREIESLVRQAHEQWLIESRPELKTLELLGAIAAVSVRAIENNGCQPRQ